MFQWFIKFPEFSEFLFQLAKTPMLQFIPQAIRCKTGLQL